MLICDNQRVFVGGYWAERYFTGESEIKCRKILNFIWRNGDEFLPLRRVWGWVVVGVRARMLFWDAGSSPAPGATQGCVDVFS